MSIFYIKVLERKKGEDMTQSELDNAISRALEHILSLQHDDGYWVFDLEADVTIPAEYILLQRFLGRKIRPDLQQRFKNYILRRQSDDGGWPLYEGGDSEISASVKAYFALKILGEDVALPHMAKAREKILRLGGASKVNVFTRTTLALFGQIPWHTVPYMPVEIMLLPKWSFFHLTKVSYWSRTVIVPLLILYAKKPVCRLRDEEGVKELFLEDPEKIRYLDSFIWEKPLKNIFILLDRFLRRFDRYFSRKLRDKSIQLAEKWTIEHMQGEGGIGAIFPAMANAVMALKILGYPEDHPDYVRGIKALDDLVLERGNEVFCQPCNSPIWDTCLTLCAILEAGIPGDHLSVRRAVDWLVEQQITDVKGDWAINAPYLEPGGWAFQFENTLYPDVDDTSMVLISMLRAKALEKYKQSIEKGVNWIIGMQGSDGGWGAFDIDNNRLYLNNIPFADHGALLDPSTSDLTARCIELLSLLGFSSNFPPIRNGLAFLKKEQEAFGGWYGRWGVNYIYGTWSVLMGLGQLGIKKDEPWVKKAVAWLKKRQNPDHGWGETCYTYNDPRLAGEGKSTASQTAWAILGLLAAGDLKSDELKKGIRYLIDTQNKDGVWDEEEYTGTGFPRVFYLRYHGYRHYFPLWALGSYRRLINKGKTLEDEVRLNSPPELKLPALKYKNYKT